MVVSFLIKLEYYILFIHFILSFVIGLFILILSFFLIKQKPNNEKLSPYECGFEPFGDSRSTFNVHFYLVGILFIVFDLEIMYLFPWAVSLSRIGLDGFLVMFFFFFVLVFGFIYEWLKGALNWS